jgi:hypothetical protein
MTLLATLRDQCSKKSQDHSEGKADKDGDKKSISSLSERQLTDENLGVPSKVTYSRIQCFQEAEY